MRYKLIIFCIVISTNAFCQDKTQMYQTDVVQFTDSLISLIQEENYNQAYKLTDESYVDNEMTLDEFVQYFQAIKH
jgi:hypothetical protein